MDTLGYLVVVVIAISAAYLIFSQSRFASAIRARLAFWQQKGTEQVESVETEMAAATEAQEKVVKRGRQGLYKIQMALAAAQIRIDNLKSEIAEDNKAIALARKAEDRETFDILVMELNRDMASYNAAVVSYEEIRKELGNLEQTVDTEHARRQTIADAAAAMASKATVNDVIIAANEARAGLAENGSESHLQAAQKILDRSTSAANASKAAAEGLTPGERVEKKAQEYMEQARRGGTGVSADDLWNSMGQPTS